jgi:hypothetical protein
VLPQMAGIWPLKARRLDRSHLMHPAGRVLLRVSWGQARNDNSGLTLAGANLDPARRAATAGGISLRIYRQYYLRIVDGEHLRRHRFTTRALQTKRAGGLLRVVGEVAGSFPVRARALSPLGLRGRSLPRARLPGPGPFLLATIEEALTVNINDW